MKKSLGLIETQGLAAGIEAADAAVKSANVELIGYELTKGGGWTTVKVQGDVGAVKAAVDAARMAAAKINRVVSTRVIPRPSAGLDILVHNPDTVGDAQSSKGPDMPKPPTPPKGSEKVKKEEKLPAEPDTQKAEQEKEAQPIPEPEQADMAEELKKASEPETPAKDSKEAKPDGAETSAEEAKKAPEPETPAEDSGEAKPDGIETSAEEAEKAPEPETPAEDSRKTESDGAETPEEKAQGAEHPETEDGKASPEQEVKVPVVPKPAKRAGTQKGRKGGKRGSKQETTE